MPYCRNGASLLADRIGKHTAVGADGSECDVVSMVLVTMMMNLEVEMMMIEMMSSRLQ